MRQRSEQEDGTRRYRMADAANLPKDVVLGVPILTLTGHYEVNIENYRGILEYTEQVAYSSINHLFFIYFSHYLSEDVCFYFKTSDVFPSFPFLPASR